MNIVEFSKIFLYSSLILLFLSVVWYVIKKRKKKETGKKKRIKKIKRYVEKEDILYNALIVYPELEDYLYYQGLKSIKNPIVKKTFTKKTTFKKVAKALGKDVDEFIEEVNDYIKDNLSSTNSTS